MEIGSLVKSGICYGLVIDKKRIYINNIETINLRIHWFNNGMCNTTKCDAACNNHHYWYDGKVFERLI